MKLSPHCLTPKFWLLVFGVWLKTVSRRTQFSSSALPPAGTLEASPKAISRITSYHRVRLEFLSYPQFISACCTAREFGPPLVFLQDSSWPWIAHPVSGYVHATDALLRLGFPVPSPQRGLSKRHTAYSQAHSSIGIPSPFHISQATYGGSGSL